MVAFHGSEITARQALAKRCCADYVNHIYGDMGIEYDTEKDEANRFKHGLPLAFGKRVFDAKDHIILPSFRNEDAEERYKAIGLVSGRLYTAVHVWRGDTVRMISVRRSNASERRDYDRYSSGPERPRGF
jgi:uncharacterized DUF497 family protein